MSEILVTDSTGKQQALAIDEGLSLMEHLRDAGFDEVPAMCGGCCACATCHVHIEKAVGEIPPIEENEELLLEAADGYQADKSRLSCQIELDASHDGLEVSLIAAGF